MEENSNENLYKNLDNYVNHLGTIGLQDPQVRMSNAIVDGVTDNSAKVQQEGRIIMDYIANGFDNEKPLSQIIKGSVDTLGFRIHPDSFLSVTNTLVDRLGADFYDMLLYSDDIRLYNYDGNKPVLDYDCKERYMDVYENTPPQTPCDILSENLEREDEYIHLPISSSPNNESMSSNSSHNGLSYHIDDSNNNATILLYTLAAFIVIQGIAWYVRKYHPDTLPSKDENPVVEENTYSSVYENFYTINSISFTLLLSIVPSCILLVYTFRWLYFYKLKAFLLNLK